MQQSRPLLDFLNAAADMKKQNRNLKKLNSSLTKDNKELHQNIERLKKLDMQLERKSAESRRTYHFIPTPTAPVLILNKKTGYGIKSIGFVRLLHQQSASQTYRPVRRIH